MIKNNVLKRSIIFINIANLIINIFLLLQKYKVFKLVFKSPKKSFQFKSSDIYIFSHQNNLYKDNYLNHKFKDIKSKKISLACEDTLNNTSCYNYYKNLLKKLNYIVEFKNVQPDFLIFDVFGCNHSNEKYNNSIKIASYSENKIPDLSEADYSISQMHIMYFDRYFKYPSFIWRLNKFRNYVVENIGLFAKNKIKKKFCAAVISNHGNSSLFRLEFINHLNKYKHVDMGGDYLNDVGGKVKNKIKFLSSYKFSISMENSDGDGYISEKIIDSLIAGTIPIYYGDYLIDEYINPKVYILIKGEKDIPSKIEYIKEIDNNDKLYNSILQEQIFINDNYIDIIRKTEEERLSFDYNIFLRSKNEGKRVDDINRNCICY